MRYSAVTVLVCAALALAVPSAIAQPAYPAKPVRIIVPYAPGGANDVIGRIVADELTRRLGQAVLVENRPGASTAIGAELVAKALPDGYTLLGSSLTTFALLPNIRAKMPYDALRDFEPVSLLALQPFALAVHPSVPTTSVKQLIALAKANPGKLTYSTQGLGTGGHLSGEFLRTMTGVDINHVPYKGGSQAVNDLVGGHVMLTFSTLSTLVPFAKAGRLRILAVTSAKRSQIAPDIPTMAETGLAGYDTGAWNALVAPRGTPRSIIERLNTEITAALASREVREKLTSQGYEPQGSTAAQLGEHIRSEHARYGKLIKTIGFREE
ncbi:MAG TPA: tripartite tricarboxylate transporter substrate binding protein [Burkholderiales bacterium]|nr:tripartite tricarboxylate transporter substrate binding protein [Burkholderiales bacterium]